MIRNALARFLYGRYGWDQLNRFLILLYALLCLAALLTRLYVLDWIGLAFGMWAVFRMLSRNPAPRRAENAKFLQLTGPIQRWIHLRRTICRDKEHCYFKCPHCGQQLRVPRGKGKITVTCRACGASFEEKS